VAPLDIVRHPGPLSGDVKKMIMPACGLGCFSAHPRVFGKFSALSCPFAPREPGILTHGEPNNEQGEPAA
jgi:hypothetical protein